MRARIPASSLSDPDEPEHGSHGPTILIRKGIGLCALHSQMDTASAGEGARTHCGRTRYEPHRTGAFHGAFRRPQVPRFPGRVCTWDGRLVRFPPRVVHNSTCPRIHFCGRNRVVAGKAGTLGESKPFNIIDLFSGVGGLSLGSARAGFMVRGAVDSDPSANLTHRCNFPDTPHLNSDVAELDGDTLLHQLGLVGEEIAGIVGGPPCQGFSSIGRRDRDDGRNMAFVEFFRIVSEVLPKFYLAENVPGIMRDVYDDIRDQAFSFVEGKYVVLPPLHLSASDYGAPTSRKRVFFLGFLADDVNPPAVEGFDAPCGVETVHVCDALHGLPVAIDSGWQTEADSWRVVDTYPNGGFGQRLRGHVPLGVGSPEALRRLSDRGEVSGFLGTAHSAEVLKRFAKTKCGAYDSVSKSFRLDADGFCPTLRAGTGPDRGSFQAVRPIHPTESRVITPREAARLQGFPDWFQFSPTKWHSFRQIGNSVSPILAEHILGVVARSLDAPSPAGGKNE